MQPDIHQQVFALPCILVHGMRPAMHTHCLCIEPTTHRCVVAFDKMKKERQQLEFMLAKAREE
eukprot:9194436-Prorocentrum_lima.AAC.1